MLISIVIVGEMDDNNEIIIAVAMLKNKYFKMIANRLRKKSFYMKNLPENLIADVAVILPDSKLVDVFVESQFFALTQNFCEGHFHRKYPPPNVVFGGECWRRYREYVTRGIRDAV